MGADFGLDLLQHTLVGCGQVWRSAAARHGFDCGSDVTQNGERAERLELAAFLVGVVYLPGFDVTLSTGPPWRGLRRKYRSMMASSRDTAVICCGLVNYNINLSLHMYAYM